MPRKSGAKAGAWRGRWEGLAGALEGSRRAGGGSDSEAPPVTEPRAGGRGGLDVLALASEDGRLVFKGLQLD
jgi:hypothetical protein